MFRNQSTMNKIDANLEIFINRRDMFGSAYYEIMNKKPMELKKRLHIKYLGEEGLDAGGLLK